MIKNLATLFLSFLLLTLGSCTKDVIPKPKAYLKLQYPEAIYNTYNSNCPFEFDFNNIVEIEKPKGIADFCAMNLNYSKLKGKIHLSYVSVDEELLKKSLIGAQKLTQEHSQMAEGIKPSQFESLKHNTYGMVYEVDGDAASPVQFYVTDNKKHFLRGAVYFNIKPNYDSILPAAHYIKKDILVLMESLKWKN